MSPCRRPRHFGRRVVRQLAGDKVHQVCVPAQPAACHRRRTHPDSLPPCASKGRRRYAPQKTLKQMCWLSTRRLRMEQARWHNVANDFFGGCTTDPAIASSPGAVSASPIDGTASEAAAAPESAVVAGAAFSVAAADANDADSRAVDATSMVSAEAAAIMDTGRQRQPMKVYLDLVVPTDAKYSQFALTLTAHSIATSGRCLAPLNPVLHISSYIHAVPDTSIAMPSSLVPAGYRLQPVLDAPAAHRRHAYSRRRQLCNAAGPPQTRCKGRGAATLSGRP
jgi:hypothetical protein